MSLRTFLDNKEVRAKFSEEFPKPKSSVKKQILAPPITKHYSLVGTAFDWHAPIKDTTSYVRVKDILASGAGGR